MPPSTHVPKRKGQRLTWEAACSIRRDPRGPKALAREWGVSSPTIIAVKQGALWRTDPSAPKPEKPASALFNLVPDVGPREDEGSWEEIQLEHRGATAIVFVHPSGRVRMDLYGRDLPRWRDHHGVENVDVFVGGRPHPYPVSDLFERAFPDRANVT